jgi:hypothetical protein
MGVTASLSHSGADGGEKENAYQGKKFGVYMPYQNAKVSIISISLNTA